MSNFAFQPVAAADVVGKLEEHDRRLDELEQQSERSPSRREHAELEHELRDTKQEMREQGKEAAGDRRSIIRCVDELQARELQKGAHLDVENVSLDDIRGGYLDPYVKGTYTTVETDDGDRVVRVDDDGDAEADPLGESTGNVANADLLPIQHLARLDEPELQKQKKEVRCAVWIWNDLTGEQRYFDAGGPDGNVAVRAWKSDLTGGAREKFGLSKGAAQKLVQRAIHNVLVEFSRGAVRPDLRKKRANGLSYRETTLWVSKGAEIPGWKKPAEWTQSAADRVGGTAD